MFEMSSDEVEQPILNHETLAYTSFIADHFTDTFCDGCTSDLGDFLFEIPPYVTHKPHLPHADECFINVQESPTAKEGFQFFKPLVLELFLALLHAYSNEVVVAYIFKDSVRAFSED